MIIVCRVRCSNKCFIRDIRIQVSKCQSFTYIEIWTLSVLYNVNEGPIPSVQSDQLCPLKQVNKTRFPILFTETTQESPFFPNATFPTMLCCTRVVIRSSISFYIRMHVVIPTFDPSEIGFWKALILLEKTSERNFYCVIALPLSMGCLCLNFFFYPARLMFSCSLSLPFDRKKTNLSYL